MTAIAAVLTTHSDDEAILLTLKRLRTHALTGLEAEKDLLLLFDAEVDRERVPLLARYIADLAGKVGRGELPAADAASDLREMITFWLARSEDLQHLLVLGVE
jgi:hypothetical protein